MHKKEVDFFCQFLSLWLKKVSLFFFFCLISKAAILFYYYFTFIAKAIKMTVSDFRYRFPFEWVR